MMKPKWLIALALVLVLAFSGSAVAGPKNPNYGDPDIYEGMRPKDETPQFRFLETVSSQVLILNLPYVARIVVVNQERDERQIRVPTRVPAVSGKRRFHK
jgi:hypothetical protein